MKNLNTSFAPYHRTAMLFIQQFHFWKRSDWISPNRYLKQYLQTI